MPPFIMSIENMPRVFSPDPFFCDSPLYTKDQCKGYSHELTLFNICCNVTRLFWPISTVWGGQGAVEGGGGYWQSDLRGITRVSGVAGSHNFYYLMSDVTLPWSAWLRQVTTWACVEKDTKTNYFAVCVNTIEMKEKDISVMINIQGHRTWLNNI